jgi:phage shock protein A
MQEREREAYVEGHVSMADLLAKLADVDDDADEYEETISGLNDAILDLEGKISELDSEIDELKAKLADYE